VNLSNVQLVKMYEIKINDFLMIYKLIIVFLEHIRCYITEI